jgi:hypothetical protein
VFHAAQYAKSPAPGQLGQFSECGAISDGYISQIFPVNDNSRFIQAVDKSRIAEAIETGGGVDAGNPQSSEISFFAATVDPGIHEALLDRLFGSAVQFASSAEITLGSLEYLFMSAVRRYVVCCPWHFLLHQFD